VIPLIRPDIGDKEIQAVSDVLRSGQLVQHKKVAELEEQVAKYLGCNYVIAVSSGTSALHLSLVAVGIGPNDEVIVPDFTFPATANVVELVGATPVLVDIDSETFNIDITKAESCITAKTKAIIPVHEFGCPVEMQDLSKLAEANGLVIIEDAACALGAEYRGRKCGTFGITGCFSLHPRKAITTGEGGLIATNSEEVAVRLQQLRNHGMVRLETGIDFVCAGFNYRMTEFQAAIGLVQLEKLEQSIETRQQLVKIYQRELADTDIILPQEPSYGRHIYQTFHVLLPHHVNRDKVIQQLSNEGIGTNYGANALHLLTHHAQFAKNQTFPCAETAYKWGLALPLFQGLSEEEVQTVSVSLCSYCSNFV
jgi:dTDP-4-amino-4,6-dideoxygalactose transaminase